MKRTSRVSSRQHKKPSSRTVLFLILLGLFFLLDIFLFLFLLSNSSPKKSAATPPPNPAPGLQMKDLLVNRQRWENLIDEQGAEEAYAIFVEEGNALSSIYNQHANAHIMGELLFDKLGIKGVTICDKSFSFGCYHSFFAKAIAKEGTQIITQLDKICSQTYGDKALGCSHGIGHGIIYTLGSENLNESLLECEKLSYREPIGGCTSGVFMEYNLNVMGDPNRSAIREYDGKDAHAPCTTVLQQFRQACYHEMPQWWIQVFSDSRTFAKVKSLCAEVTNPQEQSACFQGAGNIIAPSTGYSVEKTFQICQTMPNEKAISYCLVGAAGSFESDPKGGASYTQLCAAAREENRNLCKTSANL